MRFLCAWVTRRKRYSVRGGSMEAEGVWGQASLIAGFSRTGCGVAGSGVQEEERGGARLMKRLDGQGHNKKDEKLIVGYR